MKRILLTLGFLAALAATAAAQVPPPVPALPDSERRTSYSISGTTCACSVGFALYEDSTDIDQQITVWINGVAYLSNDSTHGWGLTSATGPLGSIARPITDAVLTFVAVQTGTVQIVGAQRPRRLSQFTTSPTVRDFNQVLTYLTAAERERWDLNTRQLRAPPGDTLTVLPPAATRASTIMGFDAAGNPSVVAPSTGLGTVIGPNVSVNGHIAIFNGTTGQVIADGGALSTTPANPTASVGLIAVNGVAATIMRSDAAPPLSQAIAPTWTASHIFNPVSGDAITINPAANSLARGFNIGQSATGTSGSFFLNRINVTSDNIAAGATAANNALLIAHDYGGAAMTGARQTLAVQSVLTATSNAANPLRQYVGGSFLFQTGANDGGTITNCVAGNGASCLGAGYATNMISRLTSGATFWQENTSAEFNGAVEAGASAFYNNIVSIVTYTTHAVPGIDTDTMLAFSAQAGAANMKNVILIGAMNGIQPVGASSTLLATKGAAAVTSFIDFSSYTCSGGSAWKSTGAALDCSGAWAAGTYNKVTITAPASAATLTLVTGSSLITSGANALTLTTTGTTNSTFPSGTDTLAGLATLQTFTNQNTFNVARTIASATAAALNDVFVPAATTTITGNTGSPITALSKVRLGQPTLTDASVVTVTDAATLTIDGAPACAGSVTCTNSWAFRVAAGDSKFGGRILPGAYVGGFVPSVAQLYTSGANGMTFVFPASGGTNDGGMFSASGGELFTNPSGTNDVRFNGGNGHFRTAVAAPAPSACGVSPTVVGSDTAGVVTMGTGAPAACTLTFNIAYSNPPFCVVTWQANLAAMTYTITNTTLALTQTATSSNKVNYHCFAQNAG